MCRRPSCRGRLYPDRNLQRDQLAKSEVTIGRLEIERLMSARRTKA
jgi:hypothetical protein